MIVLDAQEVSAAVSISQGADALERALLAGPVGEPDPARTILDLASGQLLVMPSRVTGTPTVKLVTVAHDAASGDRVKGLHIVFDPITLSPVAVLDAAALSLTRTAAVSLVALRRLARADATRLLLVGAGRQARAHLDAIAAEWPLAWVGVATRSPGNSDRLLAELSEAHPHLRVEPVPVGAIDAVLGRCDIVVCATTAVVPLFEGGDLAPGSCVVALGAHTATTRELSSALVARSFVVVEDRGTAMREAGDVVIPIAEGLMNEADLDVDLEQLVRGERRLPDDRPRVFTSVGMAWEDAVVSTAVLANVRIDEMGHTTS